MLSYFAPGRSTAWSLYRSFPVLRVILGVVLGVVLRVVLGVQNSSLLQSCWLHLATVIYGSMLSLRILTISHATTTDVLELARMHLHLHRCLQCFHILYIVSCRKQAVSGFSTRPAITVTACSHPGLRDEGWAGNSPGIFFNQHFGPSSLFAPLDLH